MNEDQWNELVQSVRNHTPGPWEVGRRVQCDRKIKGIGPIRHVSDQITYDSWIEERNEGDAVLAASAPLLFDEVDRLRRWVRFLLWKHLMTDPDLPLDVVSILRGDEVPDLVLRRISEIKEAK